MDSGNEDRKAGEGSEQHADGVSQAATERRNYEPPSLTVYTPEAIRKLLQGINCTGSPCPVTP